MSNCLCMGTIYVYHIHVAINCTWQNLNQVQQFLTLNQQEHGSHSILFVKRTKKIRTNTDNIEMIALTIYRINICYFYFCNNYCCTQSFVSSRHVGSNEYQNSCSGLYLRKMFFVNNDTKYIFFSVSVKYLIYFSMTKKFSKNYRCL